MSTQASTDLNNFINKVTQGAREANSQSEKLRHTWDLLPKVAHKVQTGLLGWSLSLTGFGKQLQGIGRAFETALERGPTNIGQIEQLIVSANREIESYSRDLDKLNEKILNSGGNVTKEDEDAYQHIQESIVAKYEQITQAEIELQRGKDYNAILDARTKINAKQAATIGLIEGTLLYKALQMNREYNRALIQANASFEHRAKLLRDIYTTQLGIGVGNDDMASAAKAMVNYGLERKANFKEELELVVMMEEGLGIAHDEAAQLSLIFGQRLQIATQDVATVISRVADDTALAADEAARFAKNLGLGVANLRQGSVSPKSTKELLDVVLRLEGATKETIGTTGDIASLMQRMMSSSEGVRQGAMLGIFNPEQLTQQGGSEAFVAGLERIGARLEKMGGQARIMAAEQYARMLGVSTELLLNLPNILPKLKEANEETKSQSEIMQRWREQMSQSSSAWSKLKNSLFAIVAHGLTPVVTWMNKGISTITRWTNALSRSHTAMTALSTSFLILTGVGFALAVREVWKLTTSLIALAAAAKNAALRNGMLSAQDAGRSGGMLGNLKKFFTGGTLTGGTATGGVGQTIKTMFSSGASFRTALVGFGKTIGITSRAAAASMAASTAVVSAGVAIAWVAVSKAREAAKAYNQLTETLKQSEEFRIASHKNLERITKKEIQSEQNVDSIRQTIEKSIKAQWKVGANVGEIAKARAEYIESLKNRRSHEFAVAQVSNVAQTKDAAVEKMHEVSTLIREQNHKMSEEYELALATKKVSEDDKKLAEIHRKIQMHTDE